MDSIIKSIPTIQFRTKSILFYNQFRLDQQSSSLSASNTAVRLEEKKDEYVNHFLKSEKFRKNAARLKSRARYEGKMSPGSKKRLGKAISLLIQSSPISWKFNPVTKKQQQHQLSFLTLTLPDVERSKDAKFCHKELLQPMLRILRSKYKMKGYVWKCELQSNGSIHYHLTTELLIEYTRVRDHWNNIIRKHGMFDEFKEKYGHDNPNSVDIHSVNNVRDLEAYLVKYVSKEYQNEKKIEGKVWDCSKNLKAAKYFTTELDFNLHMQIREDLKRGQATAVYGDKFVLVKYRYNDYFLSFSQSIINSYYSHLTAIQEWQHVKSNTSSKITTGSKVESNTSKPQKSQSVSSQDVRYTRACGKQLEAFKISFSGNTLPNNLEMSVCEKPGFSHPPSPISSPAGGLRSAVLATPQG